MAIQSLMLTTRKTAKHARFEYYHILNRTIRVRISIRSHDSKIGNFARKCAVYTLTNKGGSYLEIE